MVEDERSITEPLAEALAREGFDTQVAETVAEALELAQRGPDLVLLDVMLPDGSGYDFCRRLRESSRVPIIMLTARGEETDRVVGLELGSRRLRRQAVQRARGGRAHPRGAAPRGRGRARAGRADRGRLTPARPGPPQRDARRRPARPDAQGVRAARAADVRGRRSVITRERLIDEVWDVNWFGSTKTLDVHVSGLRRKLGDNSNSPRFIHTVRGVGFRFSGPRSCGPPGLAGGGVRVRAGTRDRRPARTAGAEPVAARRRRDPQRGARPGAAAGRLRRAGWASATSSSASRATPRSACAGA